MAWNYKHLPLGLQALAVENSVPILLSDGCPFEIIIRNDKRLARDFHGCINWTMHDNYSARLLAVWNSISCRYLLGIHLKFLEKLAEDCQGLPDLYQSDDVCQLFR